MTRTLCHSPHSYFPAGQVTFFSGASHIPCNHLRWTKMLNGSKSWRQLQTTPSPARGWNTKFEPQFRDWLFCSGKNTYHESAHLQFSQLPPWFECKDVDHLVDHLFQNCLLASASQGITSQNVPVLLTEFLLPRWSARHTRDRNQKKARAADVIHHFSPHKWTPSPRWTDNWDTTLPWCWQCALMNCESRSCTEIVLVGQNC